MNYIFDLNLQLFAAGTVVNATAHYENADTGDTTQFSCANTLSPTMKNYYDTELLEKTGGIVQGMSGSPIIQNGRLVGAVTHVFINQVNRGYAVFAPNMLFSMDSAQKAHLNTAG